VLVKARSIPGPRRLPSTGAPKDRLSPVPLCRVPATVLSALPPRSRLPTLLRSPALSLGGARPEDFSASSSLVVASRRAPPDRLLQPNTTRDHDRWIDRTSRTPAAVARDESCFSHTSREGGSGVRVAVLRGTASRGFTGQGRPSGFHPRLRRLPLRSLASESFAPTRSTRTPPVAARDAIGWKTPAARRRNEAPGSRARQVQAALRPAPPHTRLSYPEGNPEPAVKRAASRIPPRRGTRSAAPEVPSAVEHPPERMGRLSTCCPQPVESPCRRLFDPRRGRPHGQGVRSPKTRPRSTLTRKPAPARPQRLLTTSAFGSIRAGLLCETELPWLARFDEKL
jgi:hypothetical protein